MLDYGLEGYGLYWYCIELIAGKVSKDCITFELEHDARIIARNTGSTPKKVEEIMTYFVDSGLFENSSGMITCMKLAKRLDKSMTSNPEMRNIIESLKLNSHDKVMTQSEKPMQDKIRLDKIRIEENREEEIKEKTKAKAKRFMPPTPLEVQDYCTERLNNVDANKFIDHYTSNGWLVGKNKMKDWKAAVRTWEKSSFAKQGNSQQSSNLQLIQAWRPKQ